MHNMRSRKLECSCVGATCAERLLHQHVQSRVLVSFGWGCKCTRERDNADALTSSRPQAFSVVASEPAATAASTLAHESTKGWLLVAFSFFLVFENTKRKPGR